MSQKLPNPISTDKRPVPTPPPPRIIHEGVLPALRGILELIKNPFGK